MSRRARFLLEVSAGKLVFFAVFWVASFFTVQVAAYLFRFESWVVFGLYLVVQVLSLLRLAKEPQTSDIVLKLLLFADIVFGLYLTKFFFMSSGYVVVLFLGLIIFETLVVSEQLGLFTLI